jgi:peptidase C39-like protein
MIFLLLSLLSLAVIVTMIGFFLTTKSKVRNQRPEYMVARSSRRIVDSAPSYRGRMVDQVSYRGRRIVDSMPTSRQREVETLPVRSGRYATSNGIPASRYLPMSAIWGRFSGRQRGEPLPWSVITIGLISIFILGLYTFNLVFPHNALISLLLFNQNTSANSTNQQPTYHASQDLVRLSQLDPAQYNSQQEYNLWAYSACSTAAMTEVFNAYGHHYRIAEVLQVEARLKEITPDQGLLEDIGIQRTAAQFGFKTSWGYNLSLDQIISIANQGSPVIVGFPPNKYPGGHLLVVIGGSGDYVYTADSSRLDRPSFTRERFMQLWGGFSAIATPN